MRVHVEAEGTVGGQAEELAAKIKAVVGLSVDVALGAPGSVARSQGKAVRVVDKRTPR